jgi:MFS family permease
MRIAPRAAAPPKERVLRELAEGFRYAWHFPPIRSVLLLLGLVSLMGVPYVTLMPVFAKDILGGGSYTMGFLMGASGLGAVLGAVFLATRKSVVGIGRTMVLGTAAFGTGLIAFSLSREVSLSLPLLVWTGCGMMMQMAGANTFLQTIVDEDKRGRVMSFYTMAFMGMGPFGSLLAGSLASALGAPAMVFLGGIACIAGALAFASQLRRLGEIVRPIYQRMGILSGDRR